MSNKAKNFALRYSWLYNKTKAILNEYHFGSTSNQNEKSQRFSYVNVLPVIQDKIVSITPQYVIKKQDTLGRIKTYYAFDIKFKSKDITEYKIVSYLYTIKSQAVNSHKYCMAHWIDLLIEPYRKKVALGKRLSLDEMKLCEEIQELLP